MFKSSCIVSGCFHLVLINRALQKLNTEVTQNICHEVNFQFLLYILSSTARHSVDKTNHTSYCPALSYYITVFQLTKLIYLLTLILSYLFPEIVTSKSFLYKLATYLKIKHSSFFLLSYFIETQFHTTVFLARLQFNSVNFNL